MPKLATSAAERISRECLGWPTRVLHRAVSAVYDEALAPHGLNIAQLNLLVAVERAGAHASPSLLGRVLVLEKSSVSRDVDRLVERGWVTRLTGADGRSQRLALTSRGRRLVDAAVVSWEVAQTHIRTLLGKEGAEALRSMAERLRAADPRAAGPKPEARD